MSHPPQLGQSARAIDAAARALQAHWEKDVDSDGYVPTPWEELDNADQDAWYEWARIALDAAEGL